MEKKKGYLYLVLAMVMWGTNFIACKLAMDALTPVMLLAVRYILALAVLLAIPGKGKRPVLTGAEKGYLLLIGVLGYFGSTMMQFICTDTAGASLCSLINTMTPVGIVIFAVPVLHEKASGRQLAGIAVALAGALVIVGGAEASVTGVLIGTCGMLLWALTSVIIRKTCRSVSGVWVNIYASAIGLVCTLPLAFRDLAVVGIDTKALGFAAIAGMLWQGIICTAGANLWWTKALERLDAWKCSLFYPVMPLSTAVLGILLLHEQIGTRFVLGALLIAAGVVFTMLGQKKRDL